MLYENTKDEVIKTAVDKLSIRRVGKPEEVANVALFLASNLSSYITGETINVNGGM